MLTLSITRGSKHLRKRLFSDPPKLTRPQEIRNFIGSRVNIPGFNPIDTKPCTETIILDDFKLFLDKHKFVQNPNCCLFEVGLILDMFITGKSDFFFSPCAKKLTSLTNNVEGNRRHDPLDPDLEYFIQTHANPDANIPSTSIDTTEFYVSHVLHSILFDIYTSAYELEIFFKSTRNPVHTFCTWGNDEDKRGYNNHAIVVYGVDTEQNIYFYDVSDKLGKQFSRYRKMNIEEFNDRRLIEFPTILTNLARQPIFYKESHSKKV